jgi:hypothetical protein
VKQRNVSQRKKKRQKKKDIHILFTPLPHTPPLSLSSPYKQQKKKKEEEEEERIGVNCNSQPYQYMGLRC